MKLKDFLNLFYVGSFVLVRDIFPGLESEKHYIDLDEGISKQTHDNIEKFKNYTVTHIYVKNDIIQVTIE